MIEKDIPIITSRAGDYVGTVNSSSPQLQDYILVPLYAEDFSRDGVEGKMKRVALESKCEAVVDVIPYNYQEPGKKALTFTLRGTGMRNERYGKFD